MNDIYEENIISIEIDKENINSISANYTFPSSGYHTVYVSFNTESISSLDLFNNTENLIEIYKQILPQERILNMNFVKQVYFVL